MNEIRDDTWANFCHMLEDYVYHYRPAFGSNSLDNFCIVQFDKTCWNAKIKLFENCDNSKDYDLQPDLFWDILLI